MKKGIQSEKITEAAKSALENYEVDYNAAHWNEFSSMLDAAPARSSVPKFNISLNTILVAGGSLAILLAIIFISTSGSDEKPQTPATEVATSTVPVPVKEQQINSTTQPVNQTPIVVSTIQKKENEAEVVLPKDEVKQNMEEPVAENVVKKKRKRHSEENVTSEETKVTAPETSTTEEDDFLKNAVEVQPKPSAVFGDQLDPAKGLVTGTSERDELKKKAISTNPLNWDDLKLNGVKNDVIKKSAGKDSVR